MSFAENLKKIRKQSSLSQEELAELLGVSRQAVSKWEQGVGYPEVDTLLLLANKLNVSLDSLMETAAAKEDPDAFIRGSIVISSPCEGVVADCHKVSSSQMFKTGKNAPKYALFGVSGGGHPFRGEPTTFLGWYADKDSLENEINDIHAAIKHGVGTYELKYSVRVERSWLKMKIVKDE